MRQVREIIRLHKIMNLSVRKIHGATGVARSTVSDYVKRYKQLSLDIEQIDTLDDDALRLKLFPEQLSIVVSKKAMPN